MARTAITVHALTRAGVAPATPTALDATNGNVVANDSNTWLELTNSDTAPHTVTVHLVGGVDGQTITPLTVTVAASTTAARKVGPWPLQAYGSALQLNTDSALVSAAAYTLGI